MLRLRAQGGLSPPIHVPAVRLRAGAVPAEDPRARPIRSSTARHLRDGTYLAPSGKLEARVFDVYDRVERKLVQRTETTRTFIDPGHKAGTAGNEYSQASEAMTSTAAGQ